MNWEKLCLNLSFTLEKKKKNEEFTQGWPHFKLNMINMIFHFLKFQNFINELGKICFLLGKKGILKALEILHIPQNF